MFANMQKIENDNKKICTHLSFDSIRNVCMLTGESCRNGCEHQEIIIKHDVISRFTIQFEVITLNKPQDRYTPYEIQVNFRKKPIIHNLVDGIHHVHFSKRNEALLLHEEYVRNPLKALREFKSYLKSLGMGFLLTFEEKGYRLSKEFI